MSLLNSSVAMTSSLPHAAAKASTGLGNWVGGEDANLRAEIAAATAEEFAAHVDRQACFPEQAVAALKTQRLLGMMVPRELGGDGASVSDVAEVCHKLGRACASTAMIFAMHQVKVACLVRHKRASVWHDRLLRRLSDEQLLLASSTTEGEGGGGVRSSAAPIEYDGDCIKLERQATVISYGAQADGIVTTARRSPDAAPSDQVLVAFLKEDYLLEPFLAWDTLGMRATCSAGFALKASGDVAQILPDRYETIHAQTMVPVAHLAWASVWTGIACGAVERTQSFLRRAARRANGQLPSGAAHFTRASSSLRVLRSLVGSGLRNYERIASDGNALASLDFQTAINLIKVDASELALATVMSCTRACGLEGYRNDGQFSLGRHLRDILSSPLMINNDRILSNVATATLMGAVPGSIADWSGVP